MTELDLGDYAAAQRHLEASLAATQLPLTADQRAEVKRLWTDQWVSAASAAYHAIRATGAPNLVLVPGVHNTGAKEWFEDNNASALAAAFGSANDPNLAFDVHTYLNEQGGGSDPNCPASVDTVHKKLAPVTSWFAEKGFRAVLTEFAGGPGADCAIAVDDVLNHLQAHSDQWLGWTWWAAGPRWTDYSFSLEPNNGQPKPQLSTLQPHLARDGTGPVISPPPTAAGAVWRPSKPPREQPSSSTLSQSLPTGSCTTILMGETPRSRSYRRSSRRSRGKA